MDGPLFSISLSEVSSFPVRTVKYESVFPESTTQRNYVFTAMVNGKTSQLSGRDHDPIPSDKRRSCVVFVKIAWVIPTRDRLLFPIAVNAQSLCAFPYLKIS